MNAIASKEYGDGAVDSDAQRKNEEPTPNWKSENLQNPQVIHAKDHLTYFSIRRNYKYTDNGDQIGRRNDRKCGNALPSTAARLGKCGTTSKCRGLYLISIRRNKQFV